MLTLGGVWNADIVPDSRALVSAAIVSVVWVSLALVGVRDLARALGRTAALVLALLATAGLVLGLAGSVGGVLAAAMEQVPGVGLLRDGHKFSRGTRWRSLLPSPLERRAWRPGRPAAVAG